VLLGWLSTPLKPVRYCIVTRNSAHPATSCKIRFMSQSVTNNVQEFRTKKKLTQEDFANAIGVTRQTIIAIEKGNYTPSVFLALKIAHYFNSTVEKLFTIER